MMLRLPIMSSLPSPVQVTVAAKSDADVTASCSTTVVSSDGEIRCVSSAPGTCRLQSSYSAGPSLS